MPNNNETERRIETARELATLTGVVNGFGEKIEQNTTATEKILNLLHDGNGDGLITSHKMTKKALGDHLKAHLWWRQNVGRFIIYTGLTGFVGAVLWLIRTM